MYVVNKIVGFLISPIGGVIAGLAVVLACGWLKRLRLAKWVGCITTVWLWLWMTPAMTRIIGAPLESEFLVNGKVPTVKSFPNADAIVLHGGSMGFQTNLSVYAEMWTSADRVWQVARLWKAGKAQKIIATGDGARESTLGLLKDLGVDEKCVEFVGARNTEEEAKGVGAILTQGYRDSEAQRGGKSCGDTSNDSETPSLCVKNQKILLVTSAWHMKRARMMFEKYAPEVQVVCAPSDFENSFKTVVSLSLRDLLPDTYSFHLNSAAFHEWIGIVGYKLFR